MAPCGEFQRFGAGGTAPTRQNFFRRPRLSRAAQRCNSTSPPPYCAPCRPRTRPKSHPHRARQRTTRTRRKSKPPSCVPSRAPPGGALQGGADDAVDAAGRRRAARRSWPPRSKRSRRMADRSRCRAALALQQQQELSLSGSLQALQLSKADLEDVHAREIGVLTQDVDSLQEERQSMLEVVAARR